MHSQSDIDESVADTELTETEHHAYLTIRDAGVAYQSELWKELDVTSRTGTRVARSLAKMGLITRTKTAHNGSQTYELTVASPVDSNDRSTPSKASPGPNDFDTLPPPAQTIFETIHAQGEQPIRKLIRTSTLDQPTIEDAIEVLLDRDIVEIDRQRLYGRDSVLVSLSE